MIVKVCLLFSVLIQIGVRCSNLVQIDKLHLITPKMTVSNSQRKPLLFDHTQQPSLSAINYRTADDRPVDQVASIQYELKIVQQKPLSTVSLSSQASEQTEDTSKVPEVNTESRTIDNRNKVKHSSKSSSTSKNENRNDNSDDNSEDKQTTQQSKVNQAAAILSHYPPDELVQPKSTKQLENHSFLIHHSYPQNAFSNFAQPTNHERGFSDFGPIPEVKKIVHVHHYHHEHLGTGGAHMSKEIEKEQEKKTEKLVEKQVQEAVLKSFEEELERDRERETKKKKKKKATSSKKISSFSEEPWKPVKYPELVMKSSKRKGSDSRPSRPPFEDEDDDFKSFSHQHNSKMARKRSKSESQHKFADEEPERPRNRKSSKKSGYRKKISGRQNPESSNDDVDGGNDDGFLKRPLTREEEEFHRGQLENTEDYAFENDEHFVPNDSNLSKRSKLSDEESKEVRKLLNKQRHAKEKKESINNEKVYKEKTYNERVYNEKIYNDKPEKVYSDRPPHERPFSERLFQSTERPETSFNQMRTGAKTRRKRPSYDNQPIIELLNPNVSKRNSQLRRNWLGLELVTSHH